MTENIQVFVRCRPLKPEERPSSLEIVEDNNEVRVPTVNRIFNFNQVFSPDAPQEEVYNQVVRPLIAQVLGGLNCTVFAYGQTGTGKTYTMEGDRLADRVSWDGTGLIPRAVSQLFEALRRRDAQFNVSLSFLEVYSEEVYDLLSPPEDTSKLRIFDDANRKGSVIVEGLREIQVNNESDLFSILTQGAAKRQTAATLLNACSSRSHSVFTITVESGSTFGRLNLVDLAGSENVGRSGAQDKHAREAGNINQSLLTLTRVISALVEKRPHVPYRESKLTRILQDSLGGSTRTCMIATISPAEIDIGMTISTLDYASRARSILNKPEVNCFPMYKKTSEDFQRQLQAIEEKYQNEINRLEFKIRNEVALDFKKEIEVIKESMREQSQEELNLLKQQRDTVKSELDQLRQEREQDTESLNKQYETQLNDLRQQLATLTSQLQEERSRMEEEKEKNNQLDRDNKIFRNLAEVRKDLVSEAETKLRKTLLEKQALENEVSVLKQQLDRQKGGSAGFSTITPLNSDIENESEESDHTKKALKVRKRVAPQDDCNDYANATFDGDDEIVQVSTKKIRRPVGAAGRKKDLCNQLTLSGRKKKLKSTEEDIYEMSPASPPARATRSRTTKRKLNYN